ncbi:cytochrome c oxidase subunit 3 [Natronobiforma cellulositropha]|uniref:cytochrome c oxidase subunit 3 n=1 Tax=Natronobiforma cellulositropha TaxID=1679076 RepID=UPI0021D60CFC|nr:heme-copper oxidase subunit III [Natronobiforma cellulositropha]
MFPITSPPASDHGPAVDSPPDATDHHRSSWPVVGAAGAATLYAGVALVLVASAAGTVPPVLGVAVAVGGGILTAVALFGWLSEAFLSRVATGPADAETRRIHVTTMVLFLATDLGTFGALFVYYGFIRAGTWPPAELPPLIGSLILLNTLVLVASSLTFHAGHNALERGERRRFLAWVGVTLLLGLVFLAGQVLEYYEFVVLEGVAVTGGVFESAFFGLTGLHGLHVALGVVLIGIVFVRGVRGAYGPERDTSVATVGLYWHFVDAVWLFLVAVLYVGAAITF